MSSLMHVSVVGQLCLIFLGNRRYHIIPWDKQKQFHRTWLSGLGYLQFMDKQKETNPRQPQVWYWQEATKSSQGHLKFKLQSSLFWASEQEASNRLIGSLRLFKAKATLRSCGISNRFFIFRSQRMFWVIKGFCGQVNLRSVLCFNISLGHWKGPLAY